MCLFTASFHSDIKVPLLPKSTIKPVLSDHSQKDRKLVFNTNYDFMQVKSSEHSAILLTFIKLPFVIKMLVLSIFEGPFYTGFTVTIMVFALPFPSKFAIVTMFPRCYDPVPMLPKSLEGLYRIHLY